MEKEFVNFHKKLGNRIKELREKKEISQIELCNLSPKYTINIRNYQNIEYGTVSPSLNTLCKIAKNLNISVKELFEF